MPRMNDSCQDLCQWSMNLLRMSVERKSCFFIRECLGREDADGDTSEYGDKQRPSFVCLLVHAHI